MIEMQLFQQREKMKPVQKSQSKGEILDVTMLNQGHQEGQHQGREGEKIGSQRNN